MAADRVRDESEGEPESGDTPEEEAGEERALLGVLGAKQRAFPASVISQASTTISNSEPMAHSGLSCSPAILHCYHSSPPTISEKRREGRRMEGKKKEREIVPCVAFSQNPALDYELPRLLILFSVVLGSQFAPLPLP